MALTCAGLRPSADVRGVSGSGRVDGGPTRMLGPHRDIKVCNHRVTGPPPGTGLGCDEDPFASTRKST
ncbi:hypothetical protein GCM10010182_62930 [Actinomadura cremea]|nr:hypothetical protein GCM10010182_62930 [Actinomadura cremea]